MVVAPGSVAEWLYRIVYNACINEIRWAPDKPAPPPVTGPRVPLPMASAQRRLEGLRALAPEERVPLVLVDAEGFSLEATARILGRSESETAADLTRARYRWRALVVGEPSSMPQDTVVELPPPADDEQDPPPPAQLAEIDRAVPELGGHVKLVKTNGEADGSEDDDLVSVAEPSATTATTAAARRRSRGRGKATAAATAATTADEPGPDEAAES
jgi:hypothetical protein